jgi:hypothetical protein
LQPPLRIEQVAEPEQVTLVGPAPVVEDEQALRRGSRRSLEEGERAGDVSL